MKNIVLISCVSKKQSTRNKTRDMYISPLFKKNLVYAKTLNPDLIYVLSAKYGLLSLDEYINPYNETLNKMGIERIKIWSKKIINTLKKAHDLERDCFIFLAGLNYRKFLVPKLKNYKIPMEGLTIGQQLKWLNNKIRNV